MGFRLSSDVMEKKRGDLSSHPQHDLLLGLRINLNVILRVLG